MDRPGSGKSTFLDSDLKSSRISNFSLIVKTFIDEKKLENVSFIAQSCGSAFLIDFIEKYPSCAQKAFLVSPWFSLDTEGSSSLFSAARYLPNWLLGGVFAIGGVFEKMSLSMVDPDTLLKTFSQDEQKLFENRAELVAKIACVSSKEDNGGKLADVKVALEKYIEMPNLKKCLKNYRNELFIFHGLEDDMVPLKVASSVFSNLGESPKLHFKVFEKGTHNLIFNVNLLSLIFSSTC